MVVDIRRIELRTHCLVLTRTGKPLCIPSAICPYRSPYRKKGCFIAHTRQTAFLSISATTKTAEHPCWLAFRGFELLFRCFSVSIGVAYI